MALTLEELTQKQKFSLDDLKENQQNKVSLKQKKTGVVLIIIALFFIFIFSLLFFFDIQTGVDEMVFLPIMGMLGFLILAVDGCLPIFLNKVQVMEGEIEKKYSKFYLGRFSSYKIFYIVIKNVDFPVCKDLYDSIQVGDTYKVYYLKSAIFKNIKALSLEASK